MDAPSGPAKTTSPKPAKPVKAPAATSAAPAPDLAREVQDLRRRVASLEAQVVALARAPAIAQVPATPGPTAWLPVPEDRPAPALPSAGAPSPARGPGSEPGRRGPASGTWLSLAGILVLGLGVVFFLKLAYDRGWVPFSGRYAIGIVGGLALWGLGDLLRRRVDVRFAQALAAGGAIIAYITVYVGYAAPEYRAALGMRLPLELVLLTLVAVALAGYAFWRGWQLLAVAAVALGTILLAPAGDFSTAGVLYAVLLDTALLAVAAGRRWLAVVWVSLAGANVAIAAGLGADVHWGLLVCSAVLVNGAAVVAATRGAGTVAGIAPATVAQSVVSLLLAAVETGFALTDTELVHPFAWSFLGFGVLGLVLALALRSNGGGAAVTAAVLLTIWPFLHFESEAVLVLVLTALGAAALLVGRLWPRPAVRLGGLVASLPALALAVVLLAADPDDLFDDRLGVALGASLAVALCAATHWGLTRGGQPSARVPAYGALAVAFGVVLVALARTLDGWTITVSWAALGLAAVVLALAMRLPDLRAGSLAVFGFVLVRIFTFDIAELSVVGRVLAFIATGLLLLLAAFLIARVRRQGVGADR